MPGLSSSGRKVSPWRRHLHSTIQLQRQSPSIAHHVHSVRLILLGRGVNIANKTHDRRLDVRHKRRLQRRCARHRAHHRTTPAWPSFSAPLPAAECYMHPPAQTLECACAPVAHWQTISTLGMFQYTCPIDLLCHRVRVCVILVSVVLAHTPHTGSPRTLPGCSSAVCTTRCADVQS